MIKMSNVFFAVKGLYKLNKMIKTTRKVSSVLLIFIITVVHFAKIGCGLHP